MTLEMDDEKKIDEISTVKKKKPHKMQIVWGNVLLFVFLHGAMLHGFTLKKKTISLVVGWTIGFMQGKIKLKINSSVVEIKLLFTYISIK